MLKGIQVQQATIHAISKVRNRSLTEDSNTSSADQAEHTVFAGKHELPEENSRTNGAGPTGQRHGRRGIYSGGGASTI